MSNINMVSARNLYLVFVVSATDEPMQEGRCVSRQGASWTVPICMLKITSMAMMRQLAILSSGHVIYNDGSSAAK